MFCGCGKPALVYKVTPYNFHHGHRTEAGKVRPLEQVVEVFDSKLCHVRALQLTQAGASSAVAQSETAAISAVRIKGEEVAALEEFVRERQNGVDRLRRQSAGSLEPHFKEPHEPSPVPASQQQSVHQDASLSQNPYEQFLARVSLLASLRDRQLQLGTKWRGLFEEAGAFSAKEDGGGVLALRMLEAMSRTKGPGKVRASTHHIVAALRVSENLFGRHG